MECSLRQLYYLHMLFLRWHIKIFSEKTAAMRVTTEQMERNVKKGHDCKVSKSSSWHETIHERKEKKKKQAWHQMTSRSQRTHSYFTLKSLCLCSSLQSGKNHIKNSNHKAVTIERSEWKPFPRKQMAILFPNVQWEMSSAEVQRSLLRHGKGDKAELQGQTDYSVTDAMCQTGAEIC